MHSLRHIVAASYKLIICNPPPNKSVLALEGEEKVTKERKEKGGRNEG